MIAAITAIEWLRPAWLLAFIPAALLFAWHWRSSSARSGWEAHIDAALLGHLLDTHKSHRKGTHGQRLVSIAALTAASIAIIAMAGPALDRMPQTPEKAGDTMVIIADLSLSMYAQDIAPSRLTRMRYKLLELLAQRVEGDTGLIAYSGDAHIVSPLTDDANTIAAMVPALSPDIMPKIGSNAASAFALAQTMLNNKQQPHVVWFTDDSTEHDARALKALLASSAARLSIIGIGTETGSPIPMPSGKFLKNQQGAIANAPLPSNLLRRLAADNGGQYITMSASNSDIEQLSRSVNARRSGEPTKTSDVVFDSWQDLGGILSLALLPFALLAFRRGWLLSIAISLSLYLPSLSLLVLTTPVNADALTSAEKIDRKHIDASLWLKPNQRAARALARGNAEQASALFEREDWRGVAAFEAGDYDTAVTAFRNYLSGDETTTLGAAESHYNLGHALAKQGDLAGALESYEKALDQRPDFSQAQRAHDIVKQLLEQQKRNQEQQQQDQDNEDGAEGEPDADQSGESSNDKNSDQNHDSAQESQPSDENGSQQQSQQDAQQDDQQENQDEQEAASQESSSEKSAEAEEREAALEQSESDGDENEESAQLTQAQNTQEQAQLQQWLNKIEDDPSGLLRRKFQYQRQLRERQGDVVETNDDGKIW